MDHWYYEYVVPEDIDEVLKPFEKNETRKENINENKIRVLSHRKDE